MIKRSSINSPQTQNRSIRKVIVFSILALILALIWYLFIRPFEYEVRFRVKTVPGNIIQTLRIWDRSQENIGEIDIDSLNKITQAVVASNRNYIYEWQLSVENDSITKVSVHISEPDRSIRNKLMIPFAKTQIEIDAENITRHFYDILKEHLEITDVTIIGESKTPSGYCLCTNVKTTQLTKAEGMMRDYWFITSFIAKTGLTPKGPPLIKVKHWNHSKGSLEFDFCFPILETDSLPKHPALFFREIPSEKALKAVYNGNYITSDRAWYALLHFANRHGYTGYGFPVEFFHSNPTLGIDEMKWTTDIYLPLK